MNTLASDRRWSSAPTWWQTTALVDLAWLLIFALGLRLATYNGLFGSDDGTYIASAIDVATGAWSPANYNGALRYGFNIPAGAFVWLFGPSAFAVNLWPLLCSLVEVACVYAFVGSIMDRRAAIFAAALMATLPLHIAVATRIHADPVVSMFITLSFTLLWFGWKNHSIRLLFGCGLALGGIFWAKELVAVTWLAFLPLLWLFKGRWRDVVPVLAGASLMLLLHGLLMTAINGHPLHLVTTVLSAVNRHFIGAMSGEDAPGYYFRYLFFDVRHTGLVAFIAVVGLWLGVGRLKDRTVQSTGLAFAAAWLLGLVFVLSFLPVSLSPLRFVMKQSNYITLFLAPMAIFAGIALAHLPSRWALPVFGAAALVGVSLGLLQQADYRAFTSNSKALAEKLVALPEAVFVGSTNNDRLSAVWARRSFPGQDVAVVVAFHDVQLDPEGVRRQVFGAKEVYAVLDRQTFNWVAGPSPVVSPLPCWGPPIERLTPSDLGIGNRFADWLARGSAVMSGLGLPGARSAEIAFAGLARPKPADLYRVDGSDVLCRPLQ